MTQEDLAIKISALSRSQQSLIGDVIGVFQLPIKSTVHTTNLLTANAIDYFGDSLRIHHAFSDEPFSKDKFEYLMVKSLKHDGLDAELAPKGNPGHDVSIGGIKKISLKTQSDKSTKIDKIWISKFMELGKGEWSDKIEHLTPLRDSFLNHLTHYDEIYSLRALKRGPVHWHYELVEIPKPLFEMAEHGIIRMQFKSVQMPKPGYCDVVGENDESLFSLYFDGGSERKLQVKNLLKSKCIVHAEWTFSTEGELQKNTDPDEEKIQLGKFETNWQGLKRKFTGLK